MSGLRSPPRYHTFLLILWEERNQDAKSPSVWRFRLEDPQTGQRLLLADEHSLIEHLAQWRARQEEDSGGEEE